MNPIQRLWSRYVDASRQDVAKQTGIFKKKIVEEGARNDKIFPVIHPPNYN
jgi:hypothetical protein